MASIGIMLACDKTCTVIFLSLILMTAGFVLTLMGWFAPPMNNFVLNVRMEGPIALLIGAVFMLCSCLMCALDQGKCFQCCYKHRNRIMKNASQLEAERLHSTNWTTSQIDDLTDDYAGGEPGENRIDHSMVMVNHSAQVDDPFHKNKETRKLHKGYQPVASEEDNTEVPNTSHMNSCNNKPVREQINTRKFNNIQSSRPLNCPVGNKQNRSLGRSTVYTDFCSNQPECPLTPKARHLRFPNQAKDANVNNSDVIICSNNTLHEDTEVAK